MPFFFNLDVSIYLVSTVLALAVAITVLGTGPRRTLNWLFALFGLCMAVNAAASVLERLCLWLQVGRPLFWLEVGGISLACMGPVLLAFTARYVDRRSAWIDRFVVLGLAACAVCAVPLFRHQLMFNVRLDENGMATWDTSGLGYAVMGSFLVFYVWSAVLFWQVRRRTGEHYLALGTVILVLGYTVGAALRSFFPFPLLSFSTLVSLLILSYGIVTRQLLNPLRELTADLERKVAERTAELQTAAARLEETNRSLQQTNQSLARRTVQLETASEVAREAAASQEIHELLARTTRLIRQRFDYCLVSAFLLDERSEYAVLSAADGDTAHLLLEQGIRFKLGEPGIVSRVVQTGQYGLVSDVSSDALAPQVSLAPEARSELVLPLKAGQRVVGALEMQGRALAAFEPNDVAVLQTIADQIAVAIQNVQLVAEARAAVSKMEAAQRRYLAEVWTREMESRPGLLGTYGQPGTPVADAELPLELEQAVVRGEVVAVSQSTPGSGGALLAAPIRLGGQILGIIDVRDSGGGRRWTEDDRLLIEAVSAQVALAMENTRLFEETQQSLSETQALYQVSRAIGSAATPAEVRQALVEHASQTGVDVVRVLLLETDDAGQPSHIVMAESWTADNRPTQPFGTRLPMADYPLSAFLTPDQTVVVEDVLTDPRLNDLVRALMALSQLRSFVIVPVAVAGRQLGGLLVGNTAPSLYDDKLIRSLWTLASQAAIAIENQQLLTTTERRAQRERLLREITGRIRGSADIQTIMRTTVEELGRALGVSQTTLRLGTSDQLQAPPVSAGTREQLDGGTGQRS